MNALPSGPALEARAAELRRSACSLAREAGTPLVSLSLAAPARSGELLLGLSPGEIGSYFAAPGGSELVGLGALRTLVASGPERFGLIQRQAEALFADLPQGNPARLYGGFAFQPGRAASSTWAPFGEARFVLPRLSYERRGERAELTLLLEAAELADGRADAALELTARVLEALERAPTSSGAPASSNGLRLPSVELGEDTVELWRQQIRSIGEAIARGELEKVVLARRVDVPLAQPIAPSVLLERLRGLAPECARFAFSSGGPTFLGATPERLVTKRGPEFETEAVAGSFDVRRGTPARLLESVKNREEQAIVLRELLRDLAPLARSIEHSALPELHVLRHVAHLRTRVRGTLGARHHVLELVERLHPTPAVAGAPTAGALAWIAEHESAERGWYAGPVGWIDGAGDGEFVVALRSGVLTARELSLYAGAGIVRGSEADEELAETRWKLAALLGALGVPA